MNSDELRTRIVDIPDHPIPGVVFRDIFPLLGDADCFDYVVDQFATWAKPLRPDYVAAVDARGFILGGAIAAALHIGFVPFRKAGKLPRSRIAQTFDGEYATDTLEIHRDSFPTGARILIHDDLIALGHCARACADLVEKLGGEVAGLAFLIELTYLNGRRNVSGYEFRSIVQY
jgi:adenine phosphoribosyltransferase